LITLANIRTGLGPVRLCQVPRSSRINEETHLERRRWVSSLFEKGFRDKSTTTAAEERKSRPSLGPRVDQACRPPYLKCKIGKNGHPTHQATLGRGGTSPSVAVALRFDLDRPLKTRRIGPPCQHTLFFLPNKGDSNPGSQPVNLGFGRSRSNARTIPWSREER
jgi:hypothetical protein